MTSAAAEAVYGVGVEAGSIDANATARHRAALAASGLDTERGRDVRLDAETTERLGLGGGGVELVNPVGAPLRAWIAEIVPTNGSPMSRRGSGVAETLPVALDMLGMTDGVEVEIRAVHSGTLTQAGG